MEITNAALEWTSEDVLQWRNFLATTAGSRLLPKLVESAPALLQEGDVNSILIRNGKVLGFQESVRTLLSLAVIQPDPPQMESAYPDVTDDSKWPDGQKTTEENKP
jgi:hypothetical protein